MNGEKIQIMNERRKEGKGRQETKLEEEKRDIEDVRKELKKEEYFILGSYVWDKIFKTSFARDIDIFIRRGNRDKIPEIDKINKEKPHHITEIDWKQDIKKFGGIYNIEMYYLLSGGRIIHPKSYPEKPKILSLVPEHKESILSFGDVIAGIKIFLRYGLKPTNEVKEKWKEALENNKEDTAGRKYILEGLTGEGEREVVLKELKKFLPQDAEEEKNKEDFD